MTEPNGNDRMALIKARVKATIPSPAAAPVPPSYAAAVKALKACVKSYSPERYAAARSALAACEANDETAHLPGLVKLASYTRQARDMDHLVSLAEQADKLHRAFASGGTK